MPLFLYIHSLACSGTLITVGYLAQTLRRPVNQPDPWEVAVSRLACMAPGRMRGRRSLRALPRSLWALRASVALAAPSRGALLLAVACCALLFALALALGSWSRVSRRAGAAQPALRASNCSALLLARGGAAVGASRAALLRSSDASWAAHGAPPRADLRARCAAAAASFVLRATACGFPGVEREDCVAVGCCWAGDLPPRSEGVATEPRLCFAAAGEHTGAVGMCELSHEDEVLGGSVEGEAYFATCTSQHVVPAAAASSVTMRPVRSFYSRSFWREVSNQNFSHATAVAVASCPARPHATVTSLAGVPLDDCGTPSDSEGFGEAQCVRRGCCWHGRADARVVNRYVSVPPRCTFPRVDLVPSQSRQVPAEAALSAESQPEAVPRLPTRPSETAIDTPLAPFPAHPERPLFSVVVPCYAQEHLVSVALHSVLWQTFSAWELLVVDDGSPKVSADSVPGFATWFPKGTPPNATVTCADVARAVLAAAARRITRGPTRRGVLPQRVQVVRWPNAGLAASRNRAIRSLARAPYVCPLDADDVLSPDFLRQAALGIEQAVHEEGLAAPPDILYADQAFFGDDARVGGLWYLAPRMTLSYASQRGPFPVTTVVSRGAFLKAGGYPMDMFAGNEDYSFWLALLKGGATTRKVPGLSSWYRIGQQSMSRSATYSMMGLPMLRGKHAWLYANRFADQVAVSAGDVLCHLPCDGAVHERLAHAADKQSHHCSAWLWLALAELKRGVLRSSEAGPPATLTAAKKLVRRGLSRCAATSVGAVEGAQLRLLLRMLELGTSPAAAPHWVRLRDDIASCDEMPKGHASCAACAARFTDLVASAFGTVEATPEEALCHEFAAPIPTQVETISALSLSAGQEDTQTAAASANEPFWELHTRYTWLLTIRIQKTGTKATFLPLHDQCGQRQWTRLSWDSGCYCQGRPGDLPGGSGPGGGFDHQCSGPTLPMACIANAASRPAPRVAWDNVPHADYADYASGLRAAGVDPDGVEVAWLTQLRRPIERMISELHHVRASGVTRVWDYAIPVNATWGTDRNSEGTASADILYEWATCQMCGRAMNRQTRMLAGVGGQPWEEVYSSPEEMLAVAKRHLNRTVWFGMAGRQAESLWLLQSALPELALRVRQSQQRSVARAAGDRGDGDTQLMWREAAEPRAVEAMRILRMRNALDIELFEFAQRLFDRRLASALEAAERARNDTITRQPDNFPANMLTT